MMMKTIDERSMLETTSLLRITECSSNSSPSSSPSSSIGNNSDTHDQDQDQDDDDDGIQSHYDYNNNNGSSSSFDDAIQALEQALPIRRGISTFYNGKSKSFTSLNNEWPTTPTSIQDIAKPETPYTRKRRNLGAFKLPYMNTGRITKKSKTSTTTLHFTLGREKVNHHNFAKHATLSQINRPLPSRSFSMVNLLR